MEILVEPSVTKRIEALRAARNMSGLVLRVTVEGGGCSGFQYRLELTEATSRADHRFGDVSGGVVVTDDMSLPFLNGAVIKYEESLIGSDFVVENPNSVSGCGCGASFAV